MSLDKDAKIFLGLVNYGTQSGLLARGLRERGFEAMSVTFPDQYKRITDIELKHGGSFPIKILRLVSNYILKFKCFFKYDIFHFFYGTSLLPRQLDLPLYRWFGKKVVMEHLGNDIQGYQKSVEQYRWTNVTYMMSAEEGVHYDKQIQARYRFEKKYIDKSLVCSPGYSEFAPASTVLPLAVDLNRFRYTNLPTFDGCFRIMHAPTHRGFKGTSFIIKAIENLKAEGFQIEFDLVENVSHDELLERYSECHLFIDQILGGWYGTATIEAMATGRPVIVSIRDEYFQYINYGDKIPAIHADPDSIESVLRATLTLGIVELQTIGQNSRKFVEEIHDAKQVVERLIGIYAAI